MMKNLRKLLPIFAFVLGLGLVFTQSAFKSESLKKDTVRLYYYDNEWHEDAPTTGECLEYPIDPDRICSADFDEMDLPENGDPEATGTTPSSVEYGIIQ